MNVIYLAYNLIVASYKYNRTITFYHKENSLAKCLHILQVNMLSKLNLAQRLIFINFLKCSLHTRQIKTFSK